MGKQIFVKNGKIKVSVALAVWQLFKPCTNHSRQKTPLFCRQDGDAFDDLNGKLESTSLDANCWIIIRISQFLKFSWISKNILNWLSGQSIVSTILSKASTSARTRTKLLGVLGDRCLQRAVRARFPFWYPRRFEWCYPSELWMAAQNWYCPTSSQLTYLTWRL